MKKILFLLALLPCLAFGATGTWTGAGGSVWTDNANWSGATYPGTSSSDTATMNGSVNDSVKAAVSIKRLSMGTYSGILNLAFRLTVSTVTVNGLKLFDGGSEAYTINGPGTIRFSNNSAAGMSDTVGNIRTSFGATSRLVDFQMASNGKTVIQRVISPADGILVNTTSSATTGSKWVFIGDSVICANFKPQTTTPGIDSTWYGSTIYRIGAMDGTGTATGTSVRMWQTSKWFCSGNWTRQNSATITGDVGTSTVTMDGTGAQVVTSYGKQYYNFTVNNSGTTTVKFADSLSCLGDLTLIDGRDSIGHSQCRHYINSSNDSVFHTDTTIINGDYYRNNAKVSRLGGKISFRGPVDGTIILMDAGKMGPVSIRKTGGHKMTAATDIRAWRILDSIGALKMATFALACTTLTVSDTGLQCAAVTLDTLNSNKGGTLGGGAITRWNWLADGIGYTLTAATKTTVPTLNGFGGTPSNPDSIISSSAGMDTITYRQDTSKAPVYLRGQYMTYAYYLDSSSHTGGNNHNVKSLSYTGITLNTATAKHGDTVRFYTANGLGFGIGWGAYINDVSIGDGSVYYTEDPDSGWVVIPPTAPVGIDTLKVYNYDQDTVKVLLTITSSTSICTLTIAAGAGGTVLPSGAQSDTCGDLLPIVAHPNAGYSFQKWTRSTTKATVADSTAASTTVRRNDSAAGTVTITANFVKKQFNLYIFASPDKGTIIPAKGDTLVDSNSTIAISQTPSDTNTFLRWGVYGGVTIAVDSLSITVKNPGGLIAYYSQPLSVGVPLRMRSSFMNTSDVLKLSVP
jgi:hypothetical protein